MPSTLEAMAKYIQLRDHIQARTKAYEAALEAELKPYVEGLAKLENFIGAELLKLGPDEGKRSISGNGVTAFRKRWTRATMLDRDTFLDFVWNIDARQFITNHVSKDAVQTWLDEHNGNVPPGINWEHGHQTMIQRKG